MHTLCCIPFYLQTIEGNSCSVSPETVDVVPRCPDTEEEWRKAEQRKNCSAFADRCNEPDKFVYHCVVNPYVNQTLEVCAIQQKIVNGKNCFATKRIRIPSVYYYWILFNNGLLLVNLFFSIIISTCLFETVDNIFLHTERK